MSGYCAGCDGISVSVNGPLDGNTPRTLWFPCFLVLLGPLGPFGVSFVGWEWEDFLDVFLASAGITVLADAFFIDPLSSIE